MSDNDTGTVHVEVEVPATEIENSSESAAPVTVVETGTQDAGLTAAVIEQAGEIAELSAAVDDANDAANSAAASAEVAQVTAETAAQEATEAVAVVAEMIAEAQPQTSSEDDVAPKREHWFFR